jgi:hypothetical protein
MSARSQSFFTRKLNFRLALGHHLGRCQWFGCRRAGYDLTDSGPPQSSTKRINTDSRDSVLIDPQTRYHVDNSLLCVSNERQFTFRVSKLVKSMGLV